MKTPWLSRILRKLGSLKVAVISLLLLSAILAVATFIESSYGMRASHVMVYKTPWFFLALFLLGMNVLCAALVRYPWKKHQTGFVVTHLGILVLLLGSLITQLFGIDGILPVKEKAKNNEVMLQEPVLYLLDDQGEAIREIAIQEFGNKRMGTLQSFEVEGQRVRVEGFLPRSVSEKVWVPSANDVGVPAAHLRLLSQRFDTSQWLSASKLDQYNVYPLGPASLYFKKSWSVKEDEAFFNQEFIKSGSSLGVIELTYDHTTVSYPVEKLRRKTDLFGGQFFVQIKQSYSYAVVHKNQLINKSNEKVNPAVELEITTPSGEKQVQYLFAKYPDLNAVHGQGSHFKEPLPIQVKYVYDEAESGEVARLYLLASAKDPSSILYKVYSKTGEATSTGTLKTGGSFRTGWMDLQIELINFYPTAYQRNEPINIEHPGSDQYEMSVLVSTDHEPSTWLTEGDYFNFAIGGKNYYLQFTKRKLLLPFLIELEAFKMGLNPGTQKAASYESRVSVVDAEKRSQASTISMNEPLKYGGFTFYQASYQLEDNKPAVSIFSVNYDPGRWIKYLGSLILVLGIALMFYMNPHYWNLILGKKAS